VNLLRSAWAGSQKYGNVVWSGDVPSSFEALRDQLQCGINMGLAGIPWWTTDVGGFMTDDVNDPAFRELLVRWFQFATYTPVLGCTASAARSISHRLMTESLAAGTCTPGTATRCGATGRRSRPSYGII
jgi:alpha-glucosidase (family GH31 glycosyl hydrolase)